MKGKVKEKAGRVISNPDLESEGHSENLAGKAQKNLGQIEDVLKQ